LEKKLQFEQRNLVKNDILLLVTEVLETVAVETSTEVLETEEMAVVETVVVETSTEVLEIEETVAVETSTEALEEEMTQTTAIGIVLSVIILTLLDAQNVTDVASLEGLVAVAAETSKEVLETEETVVVETSTEVPGTEETAVVETVAVETSTEVLETEELLSPTTTGIALNAITQISHSVENVIDVVNLVQGAVENVETEAVETSTEVPEIEETVIEETVAVETSTEALEEEMTQTTAIGIVLSAIILTLLDAQNVTDVANLEGLEAVVVVETVAVETSTEVPGTEEMAVVETVAVETSTEVLETEEKVAEESSLIAMKTEQNPKKIISVNRRVKEQDTHITMHQSLLFHVNLVEIVMIK
jgi:hypothetical protein